MWLAHSRARRVAEGDAQKAEFVHEPKHLSGVPSLKWGNSAHGFPAFPALASPIPCLQSSKLRWHKVEPHVFSIRENVRIAENNVGCTSPFPITSPRPTRGTCTGCVWCGRCSVEHSKRHMSRFEPKNAARFANGPFFGFSMVTS